MIVVIGEKLVVLYTAGRENCMTGLDGTNKNVVVGYVSIRGKEISITRSGAKKGTTQIYIMEIIILLLCGSCTCNILSQQ